MATADEATTISGQNLAERIFPWRVDIECPNAGSAPGWTPCSHGVVGGGNNSAQHGHMPPPPVEIPRSYVRFYMEEADALAFQPVWGGEISQRPAK